MEQKRVAIYARVSTTEQAEEGYSIDAQVDNIKQFCNKENKIVVEVYADKGISGKSMENRLELQRLLADSKKGVFDELVVWKTSRLARNILDLLQIVKELEQNSISFKSMTEPYDNSTPSGKMMMSMLAIMAEFERTTIIENLKMGMSARARQGLKNGGKQLGYRSEGSGKDSRLVVVPEEAEVVKKIYELYISGNGYKAIASRLNKEGYKTVKGNFYSITGVRDILMNPTYAGKITFNKLVDYSTKRRKGKNENFILVDGQHESIISTETWNKVQEIMSLKDDKYPNSYSGKYPLTGIMVCPVCGHGMVAAMTTKKLKDGTTKRFRFYSCGQFRNKGSIACKANSVRAEEAEEYVFNRIKEVLLDDNILKDIVAKLNSSREQNLQPLQNELNQLEKSLKSMLQKKERIFNLYEDGSIDRKVLNERLTGIEAEINKITSRQSEIRFEIDRDSSEAIPYEVVKNTMMDFERLISTAEKTNGKRSCN